MMEIPSVAVFNITSRCQLKCKICNIENVASNQRELETGQVVEILKELSESGISTIDFVGGEALLRDDIKEILEAARDYFKEVKIVTNGFDGLLFADFLLSLPVDQITVSLDGSNSKTHDSIRGEGVFNKVIEFLSYLKQKKKRNTRPFMTVNTVILKNNVSELIDILRLADSLHCDNITYEVFLYDNSNLRGKKQMSPFWITGECLQRLGSQIKEIMAIKDGRYKTDIYIASTSVYLNNIVAYYADTLRPELFTCRNGIDFITVFADGQVRICDHLLGDMAKERFLSIWSKQGTEDALKSVAHCMRPCMMNCMVGGVEYYGKGKIGV